MLPVFSSKLSVIVPHSGYLFVLLFFYSGDLSLFSGANFLSSFLIQATCLSYFSFIQAICHCLVEQISCHLLWLRLHFTVLLSRLSATVLLSRLPVNDLSFRLIAICHCSSFRLPAIVLLSRISVTDLSFRLCITVLH